MNSLNKDEALIKRRFVELSDIAYNRNINVFSDFLGLLEQNLFYSVLKDIKVPYELYGGYENAERVCVCFKGGYLGEDDLLDYPIKALRIKPLSPKFSKPLTHRDYLGSILGLGIKREKTGDICVLEDSAVIFVSESIADFIVSELFKVGSENVFVEITDDLSDITTNKFEEITGTVASVRLDSVIKIAFNGSRTALSDHIEAGKVFINGRLVTKPGRELQKDDVVSVRGLGRFKVKQIGDLTKKGRTVIVVDKFI